jgi:hypothetical protein
MGEYTNGIVFNFIAWVTTIVSISLSALLVLSALFPRWFS